MIRCSNEIENESKQYYYLDYEFTDEFGPAELSELFINLQQAFPQIMYALQLYLKIVVYERLIFSNLIYNMEKINGN